MVRPATTLYRQQQLLCNLRKIHSQGFDGKDALENSDKADGAGGFADDDSEERHGVRALILYYR